MLLLLSSAWRSYKFRLRMWVRSQWRQRYGSNMSIWIKSLVTGSSVTTDAGKIPPSGNKASHLYWCSLLILYNCFVFHCGNKTDMNILAPTQGSLPNYIRHVIPRILCHNRDNYIQTGSINSFTLTLSLILRKSWQVTCVTQTPNSHPCHDVCSPWWYNTITCKDEVA